MQYTHIYITKAYMPWLSARGIKPWIKSNKSLGSGVALIMLNYFFSCFSQWNRLCLNRCIIKQRLLLTINTQMQRKDIFAYDMGPSISQFHRLYQKLSKIGILWFVSTFAVFSRLPLVFTAQASHSPNLHRHEKCMNREWFKQINLICQISVHIKLGPDKWHENT